MILLKPHLSTAELQGGGKSDELDHTLQLQRSLKADNFDAQHISDLLPRTKKPCNGSVSLGKLDLAKLKSGLDIKAGVPTETSAHIRSL